MIVNIDYIRAHLIELFDWVIDVMPDARFEIRCIHPDTQHCVRRQFVVTAIDAAVDYASGKNSAHYNCYVLPNIISPRAPDRYARDDDMLAAIHHFVDADGVDLSGLYLGHNFRFSFVVVSGTVPSLRLHGYYRLRDLVVDLDNGWRATQAGLAMKGGTDISVVNPSRAARLAGTVSYPPQRKVERGYVTELTAIHLDRQEVDDDEAFVAYFTPPRPVYETYPVIRLTNQQDCMITRDESGGILPLCVIDAALRAILPIAGTGQHNQHLDVVCAVKDANPAAQPLLENWQRASGYGYKSKYRQMWWNMTPSPNSYLSLFRLAKHNDENWWRDDGEVQAWWMGRKTSYRLQQVDKAGVFGQPEPETRPIVELVPNRTSDDNKALPERPAIAQEQADEAIKEKRRAAIERLRQKRIWELSHTTPRR